MNVIASLHHFLRGRRRSNGARQAIGFFVAILLGGGLVFIGCGGGPPNEFIFTNTERADHLQDFPIAGGSHAVAECNDCHGKFETFSEFACLDTCHNGLGHPKDDTDADHVDTPGYSYFDSSCYSCHGPEGSDPVQGS